MPLFSFRVAAAFTLLVGLWILASRVFVSNQHSVYELATKTKLTFPSINSSKKEAGKITNIHSEKISISSSNQLNKKTNVIYSGIEKKDDAIPSKTEEIVNPAELKKQGETSPEVVPEHRRQELHFDVTERSAGERDVFAHREETLFLDLHVRVAAADAHRRERLTPTGTPRTRTVAPSSEHRTRNVAIFCSSRAMRTGSAATRAFISGGASRLKRSSDATASGVRPSTSNARPLL